MNGDIVIDAMDYMMGDSDDKEQKRAEMSLNDAFVRSLNSFMRVDIGWIAQHSGVSAEEAVLGLGNSIYQNPSVFRGKNEYDIGEGWEISSKYLSGNVQKKLEEAIYMNKRFNGRFQRNIEAIKKILPNSLDIDGIHISIGAPWIPEEELALFIQDFLNLREMPGVEYYRELGKYKITPPDGADQSILNTRTYGVRKDRTSQRSYDEKQYLTAIDIIEQTANAKTVKVFDYVEKGSNFWGIVTYDPIFNPSKTIEAQEKQKLIEEAFRNWVNSDKARMMRFAEYYNDSFFGYTVSKYDGDFLSLPDLNPDVQLYKHQKDAIARILLSGNNTLLAHDVGTGKTYEMIISVHELNRLGLSKKNLIVVPNNVLKATADAHRYLYKNDDILVIYPSAFTPAKRDKVLSEIRDGNYTAVYMAYSSFDMIVMSKEYYVEKYSEEIRKIKSKAFNSDSAYEKKALERRAETLTKKLTKYLAEKPDSKYIPFDELGINTLVVDEAHNYKNIAIKTHADNIVGLSADGSAKCREMLEKAHYADRLIFATGTPLTNSLADLFVFQTYLQPAVLEYHDIDTFDSWINTFGERSTGFECDVDSNSESLRSVTRFSAFHNLGELMSLFSQVCDFHHIEQKEEGLPYCAGAIDVLVPKNKAQTEYINSLSERTEQIRSKQVSRTEDNLLKVTIDGRKAALDIRLVKSSILIDKTEKNKIETCAEKVFDIYNDYPETTQIVFSDIGTPKMEFNVYDSLAEKLTELGIPSSQIAYVHDAESEEARSALFKAMNEGKVRVVIGSTQKLGVGVNVQERLIAIHHLSVPWRPSDMVQREGRILRKGNGCKEVYIYRYITEGSFDAYSWQLLENKQRFISSFLGGTYAFQEIDNDISDAVLSYAEVKALAIGNPLIKKRVEVSNLLERAKIAARERQKQLQGLRIVIESSSLKRSQFTEESKKAKADYLRYMKIKAPIPNEERSAFGEELLSALKNNIRNREERDFDSYQGFDIILPASMTETYPYVIIRRTEGGSYHCAMEFDKTPLGCCKTIDYLLDHLGERSEKLLLDAKQAEEQIKEAYTDIEKGNEYFAETDRLRDELDEIDRALEACTADL